MSTILRRRRGAHPPPSSSLSSGSDTQRPPSPVFEENDEDQQRHDRDADDDRLPNRANGTGRDDEGSTDASTQTGDRQQAPAGSPPCRRAGSRMMSQAERESTHELGCLVAEAAADGAGEGEGDVTAAAGESSKAPPSAAAAPALPSSPEAPPRRRGSNGEDDIDPAATERGGAMTKEAVSKDESRLRKILVRAVSGLLMIGIFLGFLYMGHVYICALIALVEVFLFRELVKVRYNTFFHIIEDTIPFFRTTQWMWFAVAIFYTYSDFVVEVITSNTALHHLLLYAQLQTPLAFVLYSATFVLTIATMQTGHIRFQLNQLCWTIVVLCLTVGQLKYIMHNVYNGLFWFALPISLVVINDIFAYFSGMTCGRKFIQKPFIPLSPNKTWEGFIGGWIFTMILGWYLSGFMARFTWLTCPTNQFRLFPEPLECDLDPVFHKAVSIFPPQIFEVFPSALIQMVPGVVNICQVDGDPTDLTPCVSGEPTHSHHHFELVLREVYPVQIHALSLSMFASLVAPFGGFLASAIKRAYGVKDFDSIIPGHGGMMDRMDCQFLMALCTWVHYNTFVAAATVSVPKMIYLYKLMKESEQVEFLERITALSSEKIRG